MLVVIRVSVRMTLNSVLVVFLMLSTIGIFQTLGEQTCQIQLHKNRFNCHPEPGAYAEACYRRNCCWNGNDRLPGQPWCFFPSNVSSYDVTEWRETDFGYEGILQRTVQSPWPNDVPTLHLKIWFETKTRLHFKIYDPNNQRYEVPIDMPPLVGTKHDDTDYKVECKFSPFGLKVSRVSTGAILFDSINNAAPLIFADQFLQMTTHLSSPYLYGIGERHGSLMINASNWHKYFLWARDQVPQDDINLYGSHPFYFNMESDGKAHGVFLLNSNAMEIVVQPDPVLTFRTIGGVLDFYIYTGPSPDQVVQQYVQSIGLPALMPYWSLGFHLCRFNYGTIDKMKTVVERNRDLRIPFEAQWADIDYMDNKKIWTYDKETFVGLPDLVTNLHDHHQKFVIIVDPGVAKSPGNFSPYDVGLKMNVFVKNASGHVLEGRVWPGVTVFPDFTHPNTTQWWYDDAHQFHHEVPYDGLWIDMNEPANFVNGSLIGCTNSNLDNPPYEPSLTREKLSTKTLCPSAQQYLGTHYNLHSLYGHHEAIATRIALERISNKRAFILTRSSFPGTGRYSAHWTGDIASSWSDMYYSIPAILSFQFFGVPFVGADVCGFRGDTTEELCLRWMQLGAFYPFMRNHNDDKSRDQDPGAYQFPTTRSMREALQWRYKFIPFFYTQFFLSHTTGLPVIRPIFFLYPENVKTYSIEEQFVWGEALLITPILNEGTDRVKGYFGRGLWLDVHTYQIIQGDDDYIELVAPEGKVHLRGGHILPMKDPGNTTVEMSSFPFQLLIILNESREAIGQLYLDDGESLDVVEESHYSLVNFKVKDNVLTNEIIQKYCEPDEKYLLKQVNLCGISHCPTQVVSNGNQVNFECTFTEELQQLLIDNLNMDLLEDINIDWN